MTKEEYKNKLIAFNSTEKYKRELQFLFRLLTPSTKEKILDIGCGTGYTVRYLRNKTLSDVFGYDKENYRTEDDEFLFRSQFYFHFDKVYFMHSFAHIPNIGEFLIKTLPPLLFTKAKVFVITPNEVYLKENRKEGYIADPTVHKHYTLPELVKVFEETGYRVLNAGQFGEYSNGKNERLFLVAEWGQ